MKVAGLFSGKYECIVLLQRIHNDARSRTNISNIHSHVIEVRKTSAFRQGQVVPESSTQNRSTQLEGLLISHDVISGWLGINQSLYLVR